MLPELDAAAPKADVLFKLADAPPSPPLAKIIEVLLNQESPPDAPAV
jgi:hypothetical protein